VTETTKKTVTLEMRASRAEKIANDLSDHERWQSHGRGISMEALRRELSLRIVDYGENPETHKAVRTYFDIANNYMAVFSIQHLVHAREYL
jgi:uncharacterized protein (DUF2344 family)